MNNSRKQSAEERAAFHNEVSALGAPAECHEDVDKLFNSIEEHEVYIDPEIEAHMDEYTDKVMSGLFDEEDGIVLFDETAAFCGVETNDTWLNGLAS